MQGLQVRLKVIQGFSTEISSQGTSLSRFVYRMLGKKSYPTFIGIKMSPITLKCKSSCTSFFILENTMYAINYFSLRKFTSGLSYFSLIFSSRLL